MSGVANPVERLSVVLALLIASCAVSSCSDEVRSKHADKQSALEQGKLAEKGWMPEEIPDTSKNIVERHNLDVNTGVGQFTFELAELPTYLERMDGAVIAQGDLVKFRGLEKYTGSWTFFRVEYFVIGIERTTGEGFWHINPRMLP